MDNRKTFTIIKNITKTFNLTIQGFTELVNYIARIRITSFTATARLSMTRKLDEALIISSFSIANIIKVATKALSIIKIGSTSITSSLKLSQALYNATVSIKSFTETARLISLITSLNNSITFSSSMVSTLITGSFNFLGDFVGRNPISSYYDDSTLGTLDVYTLGTMDFIEE